MIRRLDDVEIVLDDDHRIAAVYEPLQDEEQLVDVRRMQPRRRLVEDIERLSRAAPRQLRRKLDALRLTARERRRRLSKADVAEPHVADDLELARDARHIRKELHRLVNRHVEHLGDGLALVVHLERLAVVARPLADLTGNVDIGKELHLDLQDAVAPARLTASALHVKAEPPRLIAAHTRLAHLTEQLADRIEHPRVGRGIRARRASDRLLIDVDDLVDMLKPLDLLVLAGLSLRAVEPRGDTAIEDLVDERRLARAGHARHKRERTKREFHIDILQIVLRRTHDLQKIAVSPAPLCGHGDELFA